MRKSILICYKYFARFSSLLSVLTHSIWYIQSWWMHFWKRHFFLYQFMLLPQRQVWGNIASVSPVNYLAILALYAMCCANEKNMFAHFFFWFIWQKRREHKRDNNLRMFGSNSNETWFLSAERNCSKYNFVCEQPQIEEGKVGKKCLNSNKFHVVMDFIMLLNGQRPWKRTPYSRSTFLAMCVCWQNCGAVCLALMVGGS